MDFDGNGTATWQEFGYQVRQSLPLTATPSHDLKALLSWPDITEPAWTKTPTVSYALYRDGTEVADYDGSSRSYTDAGLTNRQEYSYQVGLLLDGAEVRRSKAVSMAAENRPYFGEAAIDNQVYMENTEIDTLTLPEATGGDGTLVYTLTPVLPTGLSFDAAARTITGTPTDPQAAKEYTYTAADDDGDTAELTFTIEVKPDLMPTFGQATINNQSYMESTDIGTVNLPTATSGDGELTYTLTPEPPAGLSFDAAARTITGTPTEPQNATEYTYKVSDADDDDGGTHLHHRRRQQPAVLRFGFGGGPELHREHRHRHGDPACGQRRRRNAGLYADAGAARGPELRRRGPHHQRHPLGAAGRRSGYTYKATDGDGETAELTFTIAIANNPPSFGSGIGGRPRATPRTRK